VYAETIAATKSACGELVSHTRGARVDVAERECAQFAVSIGELETDAISAPA
jgi:hypothetical protein